MCSNGSISHVSRNIAARVWRVFPAKVSRYDCWQRFLAEQRGVEDPANHALAGSIRSVRMCCVSYRQGECLGGWAELCFFVHTLAAGMLQRLFWQACEHPMSGSSAVL